MPRWIQRLLARLHFPYGTASSLLVATPALLLPHSPQWVTEELNLQKIKPPTTLVTAQLTNRAIAFG